MDQNSPRLLERNLHGELEPLGGVLDTLQHQLAVDDDDDAGEPQKEQRLGSSVPVSPSVQSLGVIGADY